MRAVIFIVTLLGLAVFGFLQDVGRPNGLTLLVLLLLALVLWVAVATGRGYRVLEHRDIAYTAKKLKQTKDTGGEVVAGQIVQLLATLLRLSADQREGSRR